MRNPLYRKNGKRNFVVGGLMALTMAVGGTVACGSSHHTASVACADTAAMAFELSSSGHSTSGGTGTHSTSGGTGTSSRTGKSTNTSTGGTGTTTTTSGGTGTSTSTGGTGSSGTTNRYGSTGGTGSSSTTTTSGGTGSSNRYGSNGGTNGGTASAPGTTFDKNAKTGLSGTIKMPIKIPAPPKGTTRVTVPGESAYTPPSNKVKQPKSDIQAAQASVQNRRFLMSSGSHFRSPVTRHVYYYHPYNFYTARVYQDLYNPYDPRNYRSSGYGTYYGRFSPYWYLLWTTMVVGSC